MKSTNRIYIFHYDRTAWEVQLTIANKMIEKKSFKTIYMKVNMLRLLKMPGHEWKNKN